jgi:hypothetical protein
MGGSRTGRCTLLASRLVLLAGIVALLCATSAWGFQQLSPGSQVNDDAASGINKALSVSGNGPANADVVGGALIAGKPAIPWAAFRQHESAGAHDQLFVRSFDGGAWTTRGAGTVGGKSSGSPRFRGSLNFDQGQDAQAPAIDFAGAGRAVPWSIWYESTPGNGFGAENIFASRFDASQGRWLFGGQARGTVSPGVEVPSLNIHTDEDAQNPAVAGGATVDPTKPGPWVTWQEMDGGHDQIFVSASEGPGMLNCDGVTPAGEKVGGHVPAVGGVCWQEMGIGRTGEGQTDPSLNVDPTRDGAGPDIAFTGKNVVGVQDGVPWVVWFESGASDSTVSRLHHDNAMVFAAEGLADPSAHGGFDWTVVGSAGTGVLDASGSNHFGACAASGGIEDVCSLNHDPAADAAHPRVAAGTMNPADATVPWVAWDEDVGGVRQIFVSRLVDGSHFALANNGAPISVGSGDSTQPDITFSGNTPYVSWREDVGSGVEHGFLGHFVNSANPTFVLDESDVPLTPHTEADVREPISSSCIATPFNNDGAACQGGAAATPFFLFTNGESPLGLFAEAYQPEAPLTGASSDITSSEARVFGSVNPRGASVEVSFQFGSTTAYNRGTLPAVTGPASVPVTFSSVLTGLPAATTIHYRSVVVTDFATFTGPDETFTTAALPPRSGTVSVSHAKTAGKTASVHVSCVGPATATCRLAFALTLTEIRQQHTIVGVSARKRTRQAVAVGKAKLTLAGGERRVVHISLNRTGTRLLSSRTKLPAKLVVTQTLVSGRKTRVARRKVTFKSTKKRQRGHQRQPRVAPG